VSHGLDWLLIIDTGRTRRELSASSPLETLDGLTWFEGRPLRRVGLSESCKVASYELVVEGAAGPQAG
jgi:hypothetical protein